MSKKKSINDKPEPLGPCEVCGREMRDGMTARLGPYQDECQHLAWGHQMGTWVYEGADPAAWECVCGETFPDTYKDGNKTVNEKYCAHLKDDLPHHVAIAKLRSISNGTRVTHR